MTWGKRKDEVEDLRDELKARDEQDRARRAAQRRAAETGWGPDGRYARPSRAYRDRQARGST